MTQITHNNRNLIYSLLTYPQNADKILRNHQKLINPEFIQELRTVSAEMVAAGNQEAAVFLRRLSNEVEKQLNSKRVALQVNQQNITIEEIIPRLLKYQLMPRLLGEIIVDQAIASINCTPEETTQGLRKFCQQNKLANEAELEAWCRRNQVNGQQLREIAVRPLKIQKFKENTWGNHLESVFLQRKAALDQVCYSMIRLQDPGLAHELYFRIQEGEASLADLAREYSQGTEANNNGLVGPIAMNMPHKTIIQMLMASKPGQLWPPQKIDQWYVIIRLEKFIPAQLNDAMRQRLLNELFHNWLSEQLNKISQQQIITPPPTNSKPTSTSNRLGEAKTEGQ